MLKTLSAPLPGLVYMLLFSAFHLCSVFFHFESRKVGLEGLNSHFAFTLEI